MHAPIRSAADRMAKQLQLGLAVGLTMVVIVSLYAASFRYQGPVRELQSDAPRWTLLDPDLFARTEPVRDDLLEMKDLLVTFAGSGRTQAQAALILKDKIQARADAVESMKRTLAASATPETPPSAEAAGDTP